MHYTTLYRHTHMYLDCMRFLFTGRSHRQHTLHTHRHVEYYCGPSLVSMLPSFLAMKIGKSYMHT